MDQYSAVKTINKFPKEPGLLLFGISISRIDNAQSAALYWDYVAALAQKIVKTGVWAVFIYSDGLYLYSDEKAWEIKNKLVGSIVTHAQWIHKWLDRNTWYNPDAFSFYSWNQIILSLWWTFTANFWELKKIYAKDERFHKYVAQDIGSDTPTEYQVNFILEEILIFYLLSKTDINIYNKFVSWNDRWRLWCYPWKPLRSEIYLYQQNFFKISNTRNMYENSFYDLENNLLYDLTKIGLDNVIF